MRWTKVGVISLLLVSLLLASCAPAPGPDESVWGTILKIGSLGFLKSGDYGNNIVAFVRVLLGILIFALLYMGTSAVPGLREQRNIAITVSIILAIIVVIFIPPAILVGIGSAYSTLFAVVILGAPIVALFLLYRTLNESSIVLKLGLLIIMLITLIAVKTTSEGYLSEGQRISLGALPLQPLIQGMAALVDWGIGIVIFLMLWEIWRAFSGSRAGAKLGEPFSKLVERGGLKGDAKLTLERVKKLWRGEQKEEKFELKKYVSLEGLEKDVLAAQSEEDLKKTVGSDERTAKRDESRAYRRLESLEKDLKKAGVKPDVQAKVNKIVDEVEVFNNLVLENMQKFDKVLTTEYKDFGAKKDILIKLIKQAVAAERALVAEMQKLNALFK